MSGIGQIHRSEYEIEDSRTTPVVIAEAPGRINFLGEQGEKDSAFFLSAAIDCHIRLAVNMRKDNSFRFFASNLGERKRSTLANLKYRREDRWANYIKTAIFVFIDLGCQLKGMNFTFSGTIPQNIGLASSIAIETAAATALKNLLRVHISEMELAKKLCASHLALFGNAVPVVDYHVCLLAKKDQFLILDSSDDEIKRIKSPFSRYRFLLVDSRAPRAGAEKELASRRADSLKGLKFLSKKHGGTDFKDFASNDLLEALGDFPEHIRRRSMHIVEEIRRVNDAAYALERGDLATFAKIIFHSHESLRDLYEISCPEVDWLVKRAQEIEGAAGSRMTGLGFGGCAYTVIRRELVEEYKKRLEEYERIFGFHPVIYEVKLASGARVITEKKENSSKETKGKKEKDKNVKIKKVLTKTRVKISKASEAKASRKKAHANTAHK